MKFTDNAILGYAYADNPVIVSVLMDSDEFPNSCTNRKCSVTVSVNGKTAATFDTLTYNSDTVCMDVRSAFTAYFRQNTPSPSDFGAGSQKDTALPYADITVETKYVAKNDYQFTTNRTILHRKIQLVPGGIDVATRRRANTNQPSEIMSGIGLLSNYPEGRVLGVGTRAYASVLSPTRELARTTYQSIESGANVVPIPYIEETVFSNDDIYIYPDGSWRSSRTMPKDLNVGVILSNGTTRTITLTKGNIEGGSLNIAPLTVNSVVASDKVQWADSIHRFRIAVTATPGKIPTRGYDTTYDSVKKKTIKVRINETTSDYICSEPLPHDLVLGKAMFAEKINGQHIYTTGSNNQLETKYRYEVDITLPEGSHNGNLKTDIISRTKPKSNYKTAIGLYKLNSARSDEKKWKSTSPLPYSVKITFMFDNDEDFVEKTVELSKGTSEGSLESIFATYLNAGYAYLDYRVTFDKSYIDLFGDLYIYEIEQESEAPALNYTYEVESMSDLNFDIEPEGITHYDIQYATKLNEYSLLTGYEAYNFPFAYTAYGEDNDLRHEIIFINSFGMLESVSALSLDALSEQASTESFSTLERPSFIPTVGKITRTTLTSKSVEMSSGYVSLDVAKWWVHEVLTSKSWWLVEDGEYIPVTLEPKNKEITIYDSKDDVTLPSVEFTLKMD